MSCRKARMHLIIVLAALSAGCEWQAVDSASQLGPPHKDPKAAAPAGGAGYLSKTAVRSEDSQHSESAVDAALQWAEKYAKVSEQLTAARQENRTLQQDNQKLSQQVAVLQDRLKQAEKELDEANTMLLELQKDLVKWKQSVLGYRDEMRQANQAQMDALIKILKLLGGEVPQATATTTPSQVDSAGESENEGT